MASGWPIGRKIKNIRWMTDEELQEEGWNGRVSVIELDDGSLIYPSRDSEGNGGGTLFGIDKKGKTVHIYP